MIMKKPKLKRAGRANNEASRERLQATLLEIVGNQLREDNPPETQQTYARLLGAGFSDEEARRLIAAVVSTEIYDMLKQQQPYNEARYLTALARLPQMPWE
jgi:hypothetical protein